MKTNCFTIIILKYNFNVQRCFTQLQFIYYIPHSTFDYLLFLINFYRITAFKTKPFFCLFFLFPLMLEFLLISSVFLLQYHFLGILLSLLSYMPNFWVILSNCCISLFYNRNFDTGTFYLLKCLCQSVFPTRQPGCCLMYPLWYILFFRQGSSLTITFFIPVLFFP